MLPHTEKEPKEFGALLLDVGVSLLNSGASCSRIRITMTRFALAYDYVPHITIGPKSVSLTLDDNDGIPLFNGIRSTPAQGVNFQNHFRYRPAELGCRAKKIASRRTQSSIK
jgi:uncharacterized membrane protein YjjP (DUF1212 family)